MVMQTIDWLRWKFFQGDEAGLLQSWHDSDLTANDVVFKDPTSGELVDGAGAGIAASAVGLTPGAYYWARGITDLSSASYGQGRIVAVPILLDGSSALDRIGIDLVTAGEAGSVVRLGVYADDGNGYPGELVVDGGTAATDGTTGQKHVTVAVTPEAGWCWLVGVAQLCPTTAPTFRTNKGSIYPVGSTSAPGFGAAAAGYLAAADTVTEALPATFPTGASIAQTAFLLSARAA